MRPSPQKVEPVCPDGDRKVGEQRVMERIRQRFIGQVFVMGVTPLLANFPLGCVQCDARHLRSPLEIGGVQLPLTQQACQRLLDVAFLVNGAHAITTLHDHPVVAFIGEVKQRVVYVRVDVAIYLAAIGRDGGTHVYRRHVIGLVEIVEHDLPVARQRRGQADITLPLLELPASPVIPDRPEKFLQTDTVQIHVDPDEACKGLAAQLFEPNLAAGIAFREVFGVRRKIQGTIGHEGPTVITADKPLHATRFPRDQWITAMLADVVERFYPTILLPDHEDLLWANFFELPVAMVWQFGFAAEQQPDLGPHAFPLLLGKLLRGIARARYAMTAQCLLGPPFDGSVDCCLSHG